MAGHIVIPSFPLSGYELFLSSYPQLIANSVPTLPESRFFLKNSYTLYFSFQWLCCMKGRFFVSALVEKKQVPQ